MTPPWEKTPSDIAFRINVEEDICSLTVSLVRQESPMGYGEATLSSKYKAVLFDAGNTLVHAHLEEVFVTICRKYGVTVELEKVIKAYGIFVDENSDFSKKNKELYADNPVEYWRLCNRSILEFIGAKADISFLAERMTSDFPSPREIQWKYFPDVPETLSRLKGMGFVLGVLSNFDASLKNELNELGLAHYFQMVMTSDEAGCAKPDPRLFHMALNKMAVNPEEAIYVGDSYDSDVLGSRAAGLTPILLDRKHVQGEVDCLVISNLNELLSLL